jgi:hypothetical protein
VILLALLLQAAPAPERFSILDPVGAQPCPPGDGRARTEDGDVVVCATDLPNQSVPLPDEYVYSTPRPSNPELTAATALRAQGTPCAASQHGCQVGFGPPLMPIAKALVGFVKDATAKKVDRTGRVAIPLDPGTPLPGYQVSAGSASTSARPGGSATP